MDKGDFVKVTGKLKTDFICRVKANTGTLLIIAFETSKITKPAIARPEQIWGNCCDKGRVKEKKLMHNHVPPPDG
jgi:hypothetical protein